MNDFCLIAERENSRAANGVRLPVGARLRGCARGKLLLNPSFAAREH